MANIVITTHWLDGDVVPFCKIGRALKSRNHNVTLITHCYFENMAKQHGLDFEAWDTEEEFNLLLKLMESGDADSEPERLRAVREQFESIPIRLREFEKVLKHCGKEGTVLVAKCVSSVAALMVAEKLGLPLATFYVLPTEPVSMRINGDLISEEFLLQLNELRNLVGLSPISSWISWQTSGMLNIGLWPEWFTSADDRKEWPTDISQIGFPLDKQDTSDTYQLPDSVKAIFEGEHPPIILTGGTTKLLHNKFYPMAVSACGLINRPAIVLNRYREMVPDNLPDNVLYYPYLPMQEILPKCAAIIHHGGIGTCAEALRNGTPQVILPYFMDRLFNGKQLKKIGVAECLPVVRWTPQNIRDSILKVLNDNTKVKCAEYREIVSQTDSLSTVCDMIESLYFRYYK